jgi:hypothetical protein
VSAQVMKSYGGAEVQLYSFLTSALDGSKQSILALGCFTPGKGAHDTHCMRVNVGPRDGLEIAKKRRISFRFPENRIQVFGRAVHSLATISTKPSLFSTCMITQF